LIKKNLNLNIIVATDSKKLESVLRF